MFGERVKIPAMSRMVRHLSIALALAFVIAFFDLFRPVDVVSWMVQSKVGDENPSGEIVFVEMREETLEGPKGSETLLRAVEQINRAGADATFIDLPLGRLRDNGMMPAQAAGDIDLSTVHLVGRPLNGRDEMPVSYTHLTLPTKA